MSLSKNLLKQLGLWVAAVGLAVSAQTTLAETAKKASAPTKSAPSTKPATKAAPAAAAATTAAPATATLKPNTVIKFDAKEVNGAKVWLPKESTVKAGETVTVEVHNSLTAPHGFKIDGYVPETTIGAGETKVFTMTPKAKGSLKVTCHLHPAHVGAEIKVQ